LSSKREGTARRGKQCRRRGGDVEKKTINFKANRGETLEKFMSSEVCFVGAEFSTGNLGYFRREVLFLNVRARF